MLFVLFVVCEYLHLLKEREKIQEISQSDNITRDMARTWTSPQKQVRANNSIHTFIKRSQFQRWHRRRYLLLSSLFLRQTQTRIHYELSSKHRHLIHCERHNAREANGPTKERKKITEPHEMGRNNSDNPRTTNIIPFPSATPFVCSPIAFQQYNIYHLVEVLVPN